MNITRIARRYTVAATFLFLSSSVWAQQPSAPTSAAVSASTEDRLAMLSDMAAKQQAQIEALQKSQSELLELLKAARAGAGTSFAPTATAPAGDAAEVASTTGPVQEPASHLRAAQYVNWRGDDKGINLGEKVRIGGYGSVRFEANDVKSGNNVPGGSAGSFTFRRFVFTTDAKPAPRLRIYSEIEYERLHGLEAEKKVEVSPGSIAFVQSLEGNANGELSVEQAWGQFDFAENHGLRAGVMLVPVGRYNILHDDDYWDIPRRTLTDRDGPVLPVQAAWRDLGVGMIGSFHVGAKGKFDYQFMGLSGAALDFTNEHVNQFTTGAPGEATAKVNSEIQLLSGNFNGTKSATAVAWRAAYSPNLNGEFAFSGYRGKYAPSYLSFREPLTTLAYDHKWRWKGFETEGEFVYTDLGSLNRVLNAYAVGVFNSANQTAQSSGSGALTSVAVTNELAKLASTRYGFWTDFKYHARPKWLRESFLGRSFEDPQLIPIFRYEQIWLNHVTDSIVVTNGVVSSFSQENLRQDRVTLGLSYRPNPQFAIQAAYEHNRKLDGSRLVFPQVNQNSTNGVILGMSFAF